MSYIKDVTALIRLKNPCDYAFLTWMEAHPNSAHPLDEKRFYQFAKTVAIYRNRKWLGYEHFEQSILNHPTYFDPDKIERYWSRLCDLVAFHSVGPISGGDLINDGRYDSFQRGVINNSIYEVPITRDEYIKGGISMTEVKRRLAKQK